MKKLNIEVMVNTKAANDDSYITDVTEVKKEQKTFVPKQVVNWLAANKGRIMIMLIRVGSRWDIYSEKITWVLEFIKQLF